MYDPSAPASGLQNDIFSFINLYDAYLDCRSNKRNTHNALRFEINAGENLVRLQQELIDRTYQPSRSLLFVAKKPKEREIFAANFRDRIVHHLLVNEFKKIWEPIFIHDSYACRDGKGTHAAKERLEKFTRQITLNGHIRAYYLQLDIRNFFTSIDKSILFELLRNKIESPALLWLTQKVLFWDCTKSYIRKGEEQLLLNIPANKSLFGKNNLCGLPIGNLTSQFFANIILNELDQYVKHVLKDHYYLRYVDDFVLLSQDKEKLLHWKEEIKGFLFTKLKLQLHPRRQKLQPISNGIDFLGYIIRPTYVLVRRRVINNLREKIRQFRQAKIKDFRKFHDMVASYLGHFKHANSYRLTNKLTTEGVV
ncbi:MAG: RNA-directed DNA polymerase [Candidatus Omnitrophica bacterium]|nr:RNA-directed DNA polymerase [Candidatus Omnitrophota bacterium]